MPPSRSHSISASHHHHHPSRFVFIPFSPSRSSTVLSNTLPLDQSSSSSSSVPVPHTITPITSTITRTRQSNTQSTQRSTTTQGASPGSSFSPSSPQVQVPARRLTRANTRSNLASSPNLILTIDDPPGIPRSPRTGRRVEPIFSQSGDLHRTQSIPIPSSELVSSSSKPRLSLLSSNCHLNHPQERKMTSFFSQTPNLLAPKVEIVVDNDNVVDMVGGVNTG